MRAVCWQGKHDVRVEEVPEPAILNPHDAIVRVTLTAICGSDLHLYAGHNPHMRKGDILGHEFLGEVVETGPEVKNLNRGDRVVVPFVIACGRCRFCREGLWALCDNTNPNSALAEKLYGFSSAGIFGSSAVFGAYPGGQAEYVRVPFADVGPQVLPPGLEDEKALALADTLPAGWMAAESCGIRRGDVVAVFGCGPVGIFAMMSARILGAERIIALDPVSERLKRAEALCGAETVNIEDLDEVTDTLKRHSGGRGPDVCIDAVGMESLGHSSRSVVDRAKQTLHLESDRPGALRHAIRACRKGGTVAVAGLYIGHVDHLPMGAVFNKGITLRGGQAHVHRYLEPLLDRVERGEFDPSALISHRFPLNQAKEAYRLFSTREDGCMKVVMTP